MLCVLGGKVDTERRIVSIWLFLCLNVCAFVLCVLSDEGWILRDGRSLSGCVCV